MTADRRSPTAVSTTVVRRRAAVAARRRRSSAVASSSLWVVVALDPSAVVAPRPARSRSATVCSPPTAHNWMGTDALGRDVFTRALWGARTRCRSSFVVIVSSVIIGTIVGAIAGFFGGWLDTVLMRFVDITMAFPPILLAMAITASLGPEHPQRGDRDGARVVADLRATAARPGASPCANESTSSRRWRSARRAGSSCAATCCRCRTRRCSSTRRWTSARSCCSTASLSFIGLGARPPSPEWGAMITEGATNFYQWWIAAAPGMAILTVVLGVQLHRRRACATRSTSRTRAMTVDRPLPAGVIRAARPRPARHVPDADRACAGGARRRPRRATRARRSPSSASRVRARA